MRSGYKKRIVLGAVMGLFLGQVSFASSSSDNELLSGDEKQESSVVTSMATYAVDAAGRRILEATPGGALVGAGLTTGATALGYEDAASAIVDIGLNGGQGGTRTDTDVENHKFVDIASAAVATFLRSTGFGAQVEAAQNAAKVQGYSTVMRYYFDEPSQTLMPVTQESLRAPGVGTVIIAETFYGFIETFVPKGAIIAQGSKALAKSMTGNEYWLSHLVNSFTKNKITWADSIPAEITEQARKDFAAYIPEKKGDKELTFEDFDTLKKKGQPFVGKIVKAEELNAPWAIQFKTKNIFNPSFVMANAMEDGQVQLVYKYTTWLGNVYPIILRVTLAS